MFNEVSNLFWMDFWVFLNSPILQHTLYIVQCSSTMYTVKLNILDNIWQDVVIRTREAVTVFYFDLNQKCFNITLTQTQYASSVFYLDSNPRRFNSLFTLIWTQDARANLYLDLNPRHQNSFLLWLEPETPKQYFTLIRTGDTLTVFYLNRNPKHFNSLLP